MPVLLGVLFCCELQRVDMPWVPQEAQRSGLFTWFCCIATCNFKLSTLNVLLIVNCVGLHRKSHQILGNVMPFDCNKHHIYLSMWVFTHVPYKILSLMFHLFQFVHLYHSNLFTSMYLCNKVMWQVLRADGQQIRLRLQPQFRFKSWVSTALTAIRCNLTALHSLFNDPITEYNDHKMN